VNLLQRWLPTLGRRYLFAFIVTVLALLAAVAVRSLTGGGPALLMAFFPALLAVTFYSGAGPAVIGWLFAICASAAVGGGSVTHPVLSESDIWTLGVFAMSTALSIVIGARARRAALEERTALLLVEQRAQLDVLRAEKNKVAALSKLSHDLRTPLSTIIGWAQVMRAQNPPEQMLHGLEVIERNARTQTRIIEELLDGKGTSEGDRYAERADLQEVRGGEGAIDPKAPRMAK
jgi:signal transduction histidine kinase